MRLQGVVVPGRRASAAMPSARRTILAVARFARRKPLGAVGGLLVFIVIGTALLSPVIATHDPTAVSGADVLLGPNRSHFFGTDYQGRDIFSRVVIGARVSLYIATLAVIVATTLATAVGVASGYVGGKFDTGIQRLVDAIMTFPFIVLMLTVITIFGNGLTTLALAFGVVSGIRTSRIIRSVTVALKEYQYVDAARALGASSARIMRVHILPNAAPPIIVMASLTWGTVILVESALSFLGFGPPEPNPSWGRMISGQARTYMEVAPWIVIFPGLAISCTVFGFNMLGDALRDILDPRLRGS